MRTHSRDRYTGRIVSMGTILHKCNLFVYGTLKRGFPLHHHINGSRFIGEGILEGYVMYSLGSYPGILPQEGAVVKGELYETDARALSRIDRIEEEGSLYKRDLVPARLRDGIVKRCWVYVLSPHHFSPEHEDKIPSGEWRSESGQVF